MIFFIVHLITGTIYTMFVQYFWILYSSFITSSRNYEIRSLFIYMHEHASSKRAIHENESSHKIMWTPHKPTDSVKIYESYMQSTWNDDNYIPTSLIILGSICECKLCIWFLDCRCVGVPLHRWSWCTDWNIWRSTLRTKLASSCRNTWN